MDWIYYISEPKIVYTNLVAPLLMSHLASSNPNPPSPPVIK